jgi:hypothetical protein
MNERIDKLFEQALEEFTAENKYATIIVPDPLKEKFAELIVKECIDIVAKRKDQAIDDGCKVDEAMSMAEMDLEEHFGVEL